MKTKVMHLLAHLKMGGAEALVTEYAQQINKEKFDIVVVTISGKNDTINEKKLESAGIKIIYLGDNVSFSSSTNVIKKGLNKLQRYILFLRIVKQEEPDIIHTHLNTNNYLLPVNTRKIKLFHTIHSEISNMFNRKRNTLPTKYCIKVKGMIPIALHSRMQQEANDFFNINSCLLLPNAIDINRFNVELNREEILRSINIKKDSFIIGHIGRFEKVKNHEFLIDIFAAVKQKRSNAHLILIGIGELEDKIKQKVEKLGLRNDVSFMGNREDIPELMSIMDVFVFPSLFEGLSIALIEAQAAGLRCVVSNTIQKDTFMTNLITSLSLNEKIETWVETIVNNEYPDEIKGNLGKHNINNVIQKLEDIYID